ncbi:MAG: DUF6090 family protein, partial [Bacteroidota bacterium]
MKVFRKIRKRLIDSGHVKKYLLYAIGEILLVMIGILLALKVNTWNENLKIDNASISSYKNIKLQLLEDINLLEGNKQFNKRYFQQYERS